MPTPQAASFDDKVVLVTGASRGIGRAAALAFAKAGARVIACARTTGALEALDDEAQATGLQPLTLVPFDIADGEAIDRLGLAIHERFGRLDVLISNAGDLGVLTPTPHLEVKAWDKAVAVNLSANWRLIRSFDPLLQAAEAGRAIFLTSSVASKPKAFWGAYAATKAGLEALVGVYADETEHTKVRCALVDPGAMRTRMRAAAYPGEDPEGLTPPEALAPLLLELARADRDPPAGVVRYREWAPA